MKYQRLLVKLPFMAGTRPPQMNITSSPISLKDLRLPERNPSPRPTSSKRDPTPHAIPNMVRNERSLWAQSVRNVWPNISRSRRMNPYFPGLGYAELKGYVPAQHPSVKETRIEGYRCEHRVL